MSKIIQSFVELEIYEKKYSQASSDLYKAAVQLIKDILHKVPGNEINVENVSDRCCVTYDGGNHPEYAATPFSDVKEVYLKDDKVYLNTKDVEDYELMSVTEWEAYLVACAAMEAWETDYELDED